MIDKLPLELLDRIVDHLIPENCGPLSLVLKNVVELRKKHWAKFEMRERLENGSLMVRPVDVNGSGPPPTGRFGHATCIHKDKLYLFGGFTSNCTAFCDTWSYDIIHNTWSRCALSSTITPNPTGLGSLNVLSENKLIMFGGMFPQKSTFNTFKCSNSTLIFDTKQQRWKNPDDVYYKQLVEDPPARFAHGSATYAESLYIFGGVGENNDSIDKIGVGNGVLEKRDYSRNVWKFSEKSGWSVLEPEMPILVPVERGHATVYVDNKCAGGTDCQMEILEKQGDERYFESVNVSINKSRNESRNESINESRNESRKKSKTVSEVESEDSQEKGAEKHPAMLFMFPEASNPNSKFWILKKNQWTALSSSMSFSSRSYSSHKLMKIAENRFMIYSNHWLMTGSDRSALPPTFRNMLASKGSPYSVYSLMSINLNEDTDKTPDTSPNTSSNTSSNTRLNTSSTEKSHKISKTENFAIVHQNLTTPSSHSRISKKYSVDIVPHTGQLLCFGGIKKCPALRNNYNNLYKKEQDSSVLFYMY